MLALGGNLPTDTGGPFDTLQAALKQLDCKGIRLCGLSRFYATPCFPKGAGPDYVNAAAVIDSDFSATAMIARLHEIEAMFGRERHSRWAGRTLDIDLLGGGDLVLPDLATFDIWRNLAMKDQMVQTPGQLILPHPRMQDRAFVLVPLNDVAPDWIHPVLGLSVAEMLSNLPETAVNGVIALSSPSDSVLVNRNEPP